MVDSKVFITEKYVVIWYFQIFQKGGKYNCYESWIIGIALQNFREKYPSVRELGPLQNAYRPLSTPTSPRNDSRIADQKLTAVIQ